MTQEINNQKNDNNKRYNAVQYGLTKSEAVPKNLDIEKLESRINWTNKMMQTYVECVRVEPKKYILEKKPCQRLLNLPTAEEQTGTPFMYKDKWMNFRKAMCYGLDWDFVLFDVIMLTCFDMWLSSIMLAVVFTYVIDSILLWARSYYGRRNVAEKTLTDEKFLV